MPLSVEKAIACVEMVGLQGTFLHELQIYEYR